MDVASEPIRFSLVKDVDLPTLGYWWAQIEQISTCKFFVSWSWIQTWLEVYKPEYWVLKGERADKAVVLGVFVPKLNWVARILPVRQLWLQRTGEEQLDQVWTEYNGLACADGISSTERASAIEFLKTLEGCSWNEIVVGASLPEQLDCFRDAGLTEVDAWEAPSYEVDLSAIRSQGKTYLETLSRNTRYQLRRADKALNKVGEVEFSRAESLQAALELFAAIGPLHMKKWGRSQSGFSNPHFVNFHKALIENCFHRNEIDLWQLKVGGKLYAIQYNFAQKGRVYFYMAGIDFEAVQNKSIKLGMLMHLFAIERHLKDGVQVYDFMAGEAQYKKSLGTRVSPLRVSRMRRPSTVQFVEDIARRVRRCFKN